MITSCSEETVEYAVREKEQCFDLPVEGWMCSDMILRIVRGLGQDLAAKNLCAACAAGFLEGTTADLEGAKALGGFFPVHHHLNLINLRPK